MKFSNDSIQIVNTLLNVAGEYKVDTLANPTEVLDTLLKDAFSTKNVKMGSRHYNNYCIDMGDVTAEQLIANGTFVLGNYNASVGGVQTTWKIINGLVIVVGN